ncbi:MAG TPA: hypothetical protein VE086_08760 [Chthoniobacterales bacterium]|jgi:hypothetical protein|nr:hypothetical protein [Chthoniobacterales bacterium]
MVVKRGLVLLLAVSGATLIAAEDESAPAFSFQGTKYFHRWSNENQHEFTPAKQEDLDHWTDMITTHAYPGVDDGEKLAGAANEVLGNYRSNQGKVLRTNSVPATDENPAEHFIAVLFTRPDFSEAAFARFKLVAGKGHSFIYSHRFYGKDAAEEMGEWLKASGEQTENALMDWDPPRR